MGFELTITEFRLYIYIYIYIANSTHGLIAQSVRAPERTSVVVGSNPTVTNFLWLLLRIVQG